MIFWPGGACSPKLSSAIFATGVNRHLFSFFYEAKKRFNDGDSHFELVEEFDLFVDSGAFSAWSQGVEIDIEEYAEFVRYHRGSIQYCINLDSISEARDPWSLNEAARRSWDNYLHLKDLGVPALPVYHYGEDPKWLDVFVAETDYICLGGMVSITGADRMRWLDSTFKRALKLRPQVRIHGLGIGDLSLIERFPWYSVDSTTWLRLAAMGNIWVPRVHKGEFVFDDNPHKIHVTDVRKVPEIDAWAAMCGTSAEAIQTDYYARFLVMLTYFKIVCAKPFNPIYFRRQSLF